LGKYDGVVQTASGTDGGELAACYGGEALNEYGWNLYNTNGIVLPPGFWVVTDVVADHTTATDGRYYLKNP
jgi:hypothetical protein